MQLYEREVVILLSIVLNFNSKHIIKGAIAQIEIKSKHIIKGAIAQIERKLGKLTCESNLSEDPNI